MPSLFIRLSGCNLRCSWCDTSYASWRPEGANRTIDELVEWARGAGVCHAVVTGGEPMLFQQLGELVARLARPRAEGGAAMHVTIETAGTVFPQDPHWPLGPGTCALMSVSPKLANSTPRGDPRDPGGTWGERHEARRMNPQVLQKLLDDFPAPGRQLKFVVCDAPDLAEVDALLSGLDGWNPDEVFLMPEGVAPPTPAQKRSVVDACIERGFRYGHRLHIELFGNRRGT